MLRPPSVASSPTGPPAPPARAAAAASSLFVGLHTMSGPAEKEEGEISEDESEVEAVASARAPAAPRPAVAYVPHPAIASAPYPAVAPHLRAQPGLPAHTASPGPRGSPAHSTQPRPTHPAAQEMPRIEPRPAVRTDTFSPAARVSGAIAEAVVGAALAKAGPSAGSPPLSAVPKADMSPLEESQYLDILRNLVMHEGVQPEQLLLKGAPRRFVTRVCEEIVERTRARKALWTQTREPPRAPSEAPSTASVAPASATHSPPPRAGRAASLSPDSPRPGAPVRLARLARKSSASSNASDSSDSSEARQVDRMVDSRVRTATPPSASAQLDPQTTPIQSSAVARSSSVPPPPVAFRGQPPPLAIRVETYKPLERRGGSSARPDTQSSAASPVSAAPFQHSFKPGGSMRRKKGKRDFDAQDDTPAVLQYDGDDIVAGSPPTATRSLALDPRAILLQVPGAAAVGSSTVPWPSQTPSASVAASSFTASSVASSSRLPATPTASIVDASPALLEHKRRALASMRARVKRTAADSSKPGIAPTPPEPDRLAAELAAGVSAVALELEIQERIEREVAELEREFLQVAAFEQAERGADRAQSVPMDLDESASDEEGEIKDDAPASSASALAVSSLPVAQTQALPLPIFASSAPNTAPVRGHKRPNAEDMEARPTSVASRAVPPTKRRLFGGAPQRPNRLLLSLDSDDSDASDDDDDGDGEHARRSTPAYAAKEAARLLREKDEEIGRLKEMIARKMAIKKARSETPAVGSGAQTPPPVLETAAEASESLANTNEDGDEDDGGGLSVTAGLAPEPAEAAARDVDMAASQPARAFKHFQPLLPHYPQLVSSSSSSSSSSSTVLATQSADGDAQATEDVRAAAALLTSRLQRDPGALLCRSEAAGGRCADPTCADVHVKRALEVVADAIEVD
ncbi:hypothetical protein Q5752_006567 [Cryptotrichosporon argae]